VVFRFVKGVFEPARYAARRSDRQIPLNLACNESRFPLRVRTRGVVKYARGLLRVASKDHDPRSRMPRQADRVFRLAVSLIAITLALEAGFARWLPPGSALDGVAQWTALLACAALVGAAVAGKSGWGVVWACVIFVLPAVLLSIGTFFLECAVRPTGCGV
jgi:hypothetical protein